MEEPESIVVEIPESESMPIRRTFSMMRLTASVGPLDSCDAASHGIINQQTESEPDNHA